MRENPHQTEIQQEAAMQDDVRTQDCFHGENIDGPHADCGECGAQQGEACAMGAPDCSMGCGRKLTGRERAAGRAWCWRCEEEAR